MCVRLDAYFRCFCPVLSKINNLQKWLQTQLSILTQTLSVGLQLFYADGHEEAKVAIRNLFTSSP
jgi:hypothetical protein